MAKSIIGGESEPTIPNPRDQKDSDLLFESKNRKRILKLEDEVEKLHKWLTFLYITCGIEAIAYILTYFKK